MSRPLLQLETHDEETHDEEKELLEDDPEENSFIMMRYPSWFLWLKKKSSSFKPEDGSLRQPLNSSSVGSRPEEQWTEGKCYKVRGRQGSTYTETPQTVLYTALIMPVPLAADSTACPGHDVDIPLPLCVHLLLLPLLPGLVVEPVVLLDRECGDVHRYVLAGQGGAKGGHSTIADVRVV
jgi:hypothetical protein